MGDQRAVGMVLRRYVRLSSSMEALRSHEEMET